MESFDATIGIKTFHFLFFYITFRTVYHNVAPA